MILFSFGWYYQNRVTVSRITPGLLSVALVLRPEQSSRPHRERRIIHHYTQDVAAHNDAY
jgi:hypothetical protein